MTAKHYTEENFETHIVRHLTAGGWVQRPSADYDKDLCLIPEDVIGFIQDTQPKQYEKLQRQYGADTDKNLCHRLSRVIAGRGTLHVLRNEIKDRGAAFRLVFFRPSSQLNPEHWAQYEKNRLIVVRQLKYSTKNENSIDLGLFVNGIPVITAELKNSLTGQFVAQAKKQYREDRDPREPILRYLRCLVHFAVGNEKVYYTTRLAGEKTRFLPFNKGIENPVNPDGHKTAYLWEDIWAKDSLLDLLQNYLHVQTNREKVYDAEQDAVKTEESEALIFPRFHQLDVVRRLLRAAAADGPGHSYLVQHSAGSGKSNSIAWLSHGLRQLFRGDGQERHFDTIVVVTDRRVLDRQLQDTIKQFETKTGTVVPITKTSQQLKEALEKGKDIVITTIQKFPVISEAMTTLRGNRFAVIIDEAHSSQSGESARHLKKTLSAGLDEAEAIDAIERDLEDEIVAEIRTRGQQEHLSYFAFTATPKDKTLELFGRRTEGGQFVPFHTYSMKQAIEERFILDVLENYTTFKRYFKLVKSADEDREYEKPKAVRALTSYVDLTPHAIEMKTRICLDHFRDVVLDAIRGRGRAMFVTRSRLHAVRYFLMFRTLMAEDGLSVEPLVAFSGTVKDPDSGEEYTENSMNRLPRKTSIKEAFKYPQYRILVVANKFQTGFDEPYLHTMYVDKKLGGVAAVQTLSRLNRTAWSEGKIETVVLDFVNEADSIQTAFQPYYQVTHLDQETDPNKLYDLATELEQYEIYGPADIDQFAEVFFDESQPGEKLQPILDTVVMRWGQREEDEREDFRRHLQSFIRLYGYVSQLIDFVDVDLEKLYVFARNLSRKLPRREGSGLPMEVTEAVDLDSFRIQQTYKGEIALEEEHGHLTGISEGVGQTREPEMDYLSRIVETLNETFGVELTEKDKIHVQQIIDEVEQDESVQAVLRGDNSRNNKKRKVHQVIDERILDQHKSSVDLFKKLMDPAVNKTFKRRLFEQLMSKFAAAAG